MEHQQESDFPVSHLVVDSEKRALRIGRGTSSAELLSSKVEFSSPAFEPAEVCTTISIVIFSSILLLSGVILGAVLHRPLLFLLVLGAVPGTFHVCRWMYAWMIKPTSIAFELGTATLNYGSLCGRGKQPVLLPVDDLGRIKVEFVQRVAGRGQIVGKFRLSFVGAANPATQNMQLEIARITSINSMKENKRIVDKMIANLESLVTILSDAASTVLEQGDRPDAACVIEIENFTSFEDLPSSFSRLSTAY
eukprot:TRINITY_DN4914_c0_g1_i1.p1 TRINITY_DN4914_c0_g1~~TRINITY_DN4914_c0_g1_i1.p1  ORF type:complete len:250 (-),score=27.11 TRINITY_DN4914_c0_g1_i1:27-776(-)